MTIRIGIMGYGNLGRGVECAIKQNPDMELAAVFTRRDPKNVRILTEGAKVYHADEAKHMTDKIDVLILCGGSATDLPVQTPEYAKYFTVVDSFDTHARIPEHFAAVDAAAKEAGNVAVISAGWDPGMFSLNRLYAAACLPDGENYTFWGKGVSQGHSDAIRRIEGVKDARQYTIPVESALEAVRSGSSPELTTREKHTRECFVVAEEGADQAKIENEIKTMPNYFSDYDTTVHFITEEELKRDHNRLPQSKGGGNQPQNLQCLCKKCNCSKGNDMTLTKSDLKKRKSSYAQYKRSEVLKPIIDRKKKEIREKYLPQLDDKEILEALDDPRFQEGKADLRREARRRKLI